MKEKMQQGVFNLTGLLLLKHQLKIPSRKSSLKMQRTKVKTLTKAFHYFDFPVWFRKHLGMSPFSPDHAPAERGIFSECFLWRLQFAQTYSEQACSHLKPSDGTVVAANALPLFWNGLDKKKISTAWSTSWSSFSLPASPSALTHIKYPPPN